MARALELLVVNPGRFFGALLPILLAALLTMFANLPLPLTGGLLPSPVLALAALYFWLLVRPDLVPPSMMFVLGLLEDLMSGGPPGLWAAGFIAAYAFTDRHRETLAGLPGMGTIIGFAAAMLVAAATAYGLTWIVYLRAPPLAELLLESMITVLVYPFMAIAMRWLHRRVVGPMRYDT